MYQVIIIYDEERAKSYYHSYVESNDTTLGNISVPELPPFADVNKAQSCYWDPVESKWVFDEEKYAYILAEIKAKDEANKQAALEKEAIPTNEELAICVMELGEGQGVLSDAISELGEGQGVLYDAVAELGDSQSVILEMLSGLLDRMAALENPIEEPIEEPTEPEEETE